MDASTTPEPTSPAPLPATAPNMRLVRCSRLQHLGDQGWMLSILADVRVRDAAWAIIRHEAAVFDSWHSAWWIAHPKALEAIAEQIPAVRWKLDTRRAFEEAASG